MICILSLNKEPQTFPESFDSRLDGWLIATDTYDARRQAEASGDMMLAQWLYRHDRMPAGKMLVDDDLIGGRYMILST